MTVQLFLSLTYVSIQSSDSTLLTVNFNLYMTGKKEQKEQKEQKKKKKKKEMTSNIKLIGAAAVLEGRTVKQGTKLRNSSLAFMLLILMV